MTYIPQVDDYVKWKNHEGWVYFKCEDVSISIEIGVKDVVCNKGTCHKKNHIYLCVLTFCWEELEYIKNRRRIIYVITAEELPTMMFAVLVCVSLTVITKIYLTSKLFHYCNHQTYGQLFD